MEKNLRSFVHKSLYNKINNRDKIGAESPVHTRILQAQGLQHNRTNNPNTRIGLSNMHPQNRANNTQSANVGTEDSHKQLHARIKESCVPFVHAIHNRGTTQDSNQIEHSFHNRPQTPDSITTIPRAGALHSEKMQNRVVNNHTVPNIMLQRKQLHYKSQGLPVHDTKIIRPILRR